MYSFLLIIHTIMRWLVLATLLYAIYRGSSGWNGKVPFTKRDDDARHIAALVTQIQLAIGYVLYFKSPAVSYLRQHFQEGMKQFEVVFFGFIHISIMTASILLVTVGSSIAKGNQNDQKKFRIITCFYGAAILLIIMAIPWPFSPLAKRPYLRTF